MKRFDIIRTEKYLYYVAREMFALPGQKNVCAIHPEKIVRIVHPEKNVPSG